MGHAMQNVKHYVKVFRTYLLILRLFNLTIYMLLVFKKLALIYAICNECHINLVLLTKLDIAYFISFSLLNNEEFDKALLTKFFRLPLWITAAVLLS